MAEQMAVTQAQLNEINAALDQMALGRVSDGGILAIDGDEYEVALAG